jgi:hypothetical protein
MATYGEPGKNEFPLKNIVGNYSIVVNPTTKVSQIYQRKSQFDFQSIGTLNLTTNKLTWDSNASLTNENKRALSKDISTFRRQSVNTATAAGAQNAQELLLGNSQPPPPAGAQAGTGPSDSQTNGQETGSLNNDLTDQGNEFGEQKTGSYGSWFYPETIGTSGQDKVVISQFQYVAGKLNQENVLAGSLGNRENEFNEASKKPLGTVVLPMANNLTETNQTGWGEDRLSTIAAALMNGGTALASNLGQGELLTAFGEATGTLANLLTNPQVGTRAKQYFTTRAAASIIQKAGIQINPEAYITRATGTIVNPNLELLFNGPKLKAFELAFKMSPRSPKEAKEIRGIIKFFKKGMAPRRGNGGEGIFFLGAPNIFNVKFKRGDYTGDNKLQSLVEFKTCALITCQVNYTPDGFYAAYEDDTVGSQPVAVTLQLGFAELTPVFNDDYDLNLDSVGPDRSLFGEKYNPQTSTPTKTEPVLTEQEAQRQSTRPENRGRTIQQIQNDKGAIALEIQRLNSVLYRANTPQSEKDEALKRLQELYKQ